MKVQQAWINRTTLSTRARRGLIAAGCASKEDIFNAINNGTLRKQHQIGDGTVDEVKNWLSDYVATRFTKLTESNNVNEEAKETPLTALDTVIQRIDALEKSIKREFLTFDEVVAVWNDTSREGTLNDMLFDFAIKLQRKVLA